uniref:StAR related lipid transfer domain containing 6 n=1 Tax=Varanus komodoensis TaxID=61221 RepID=A0A8D2L4M5_VARKO
LFFHLSMTVSLRSIPYPARPILRFDGVVIYHPEGYMFLSLAQHLDILYRFLNPVLDNGFINNRLASCIDTFIFHSITHSYGFGLISPRDFVYIVHIKKYDDGNLMTTNSVSVDHPDYLPTPRYVRGSNFPSGYACSPHPENPDHSKLVAILQVDLGGMLMPSLVDSPLLSLFCQFLGIFHSAVHTQIELDFFDVQESCSSCTNVH